MTPQNRMSDTIPPLYFLFKTYARQPTSLYVVVPLSDAWSRERNRARTAKFVQAHVTPPPLGEHLSRSLLPRQAIDYASRRPYSG